MSRVPAMRFSIPFLAAALLAPAASAQEDVLDDEPAEAGAAADEGDDEEDEGGDDEKKPVESTGDEAAPAGDAPKPTNEETIFVVQSKPFLVGGSFEIAPQIAQTVNDRFTSHTGLLLSAMYHIKENVAVAVTGGVFVWPDTDCFAAGGPAPTTRPLCLLGGRDTDLTVEIRDKERLAPEHVQLYQLTWMATSDLQWSPAYGKISLHDFVLGQFNLYLSVGAGVVGVQLENDQIPNEFVPIPGPFGSQDLPPVAFTTTLGGGLRFYFTDWLGVRLEIRDYVTPLAVLQRDVPTDTFSTFDVTNTLFAQAGVSFVF